MAQTAMPDIVDLTAQFPTSVRPDTRPGYQGYIIDAAQLPAVAKYVRETLGYDYLTNLTATDYIKQGMIETVYHVCKSTGGSPIALRVQLDRDKPVLPSLTPQWPGADFQEREVYDMYGVLFEGHPDLRRILMWDDFAGYPLRKDWREAFYEEEQKPFKSRWPDGLAQRAESRNPFNKNVNYPPGFEPRNFQANNDNSLYERMLADIHANSNGLRTDQIVVNMGPQHPSTHGVFRMVLKLEGETVVELKPVMGYLHRNHEKIGERNTWLMNMPYTDRLDYITSMCNNFGYAITVEKMLGSKVPERAEYIRVLMAELTRIASHLWAVGFLLNDLGAFQTPMLYAAKQRELILDLFEATSGARMMCNYFRFGGVARDFPDFIRDESTLDYVTDLVHNRLPKAISELEDYLTYNEIMRARCIGLGVLTAAEAIAYSTSGPILRGSGVPYDVRRADPYGIYDRFDFKIPSLPEGDVYARYLVRIAEMHESIKICKQALRDLPKGEVLDPKAGYTHKVPAGDHYGRVENPKGELGFYVVSEGGPNPYRYHVRAPAFINLTALEKMSLGHKVADIVVILGSVDIIMGEVDR
jgi:NADH-quinone oxidoreductase subunit C/D